MTWESVDLPEPFGPMTACTSPAGYGQVHPAQYFLSADRSMQALYDKFAHGMLTTTSSPSILTA